MRTWSPWLLPVLLIGMLSVGRAEAAIYWGDGLPIGRSNLDGTYAEQTFIPSVPAEPGTAAACGGVAVNEFHVFWADPYRDVIGRANRDGTAPNYTFIAGADNPCGVALDGTHVYWANFAGNTIGRANLDGGEPIQSFIDAVSAPCGLAVDSNFIYWASSGSHYIGRALLPGGIKGPHLVEGDDSFGFCGLAVNGTHIFWGGFGETIGRANLDGSEPEPSFIAGVNRPCGIAVDETHIYWTEQSSPFGQIGSANLDGSAMNRAVLTGLTGSPCGIGVDSVVVPPPEPYPVPSPQKAVCSLADVRYNEARGSATIEVDAAAHGAFRVKTPGIGWRVLTKEGPQWVLGSRRWRLKIWPRETGHAAKLIRQALGRRGWSRLKLVVSCDPTDDSILPVTTSRRITLRRRAAGR